MYVLLRRVDPDLFGTRLRLRLLLTSWRDRRPWLYHNLGDFELLVKRVGLTLGIGELAFGVGSRTKIRT